ncbi:MAG: hypothetical protein R3247_04870 [Rhodothermales bacterium]|nr:hypothetical protein [Rhodothermales bacterium]
MRADRQANPSSEEVFIMRSIAIVLVAFLICLGIGSALGNPAGGFIVGIVVAIMLAKRYGTAGAAEPG